jgi:magnesium transporter
VLIDRDVTASLRRMSDERLVEAFHQLPGPRTRHVFEALDAGPQCRLVGRLPQRESVDLFAQLQPDDRARLLDEVPAAVSEQLLSSLDADAREITLTIAGYPHRSTGRAMSPNVVSVTATSSAGDALRHVRRHGATAETVYMLPVLDPDGAVLGVVSLRRLLFSEPETPVGRVMSSPAVSVPASQDQEVSARALRAARLIAAPVVDSAGRLVGVLTVDDAMRILSDAEHEDVARGAGSRPLHEAYPRTSVLELVRARIGWLLVLIIAATLTVNVLDYFEDTLAEVVTLALFVPLLIGTGGNAGAQSATTVVRAMAVGDVGGRDLPRVVLREVTTGLVLGLTLAVVGVVPAAFFADASIAAAVSLSLVVICVLATAVGSATPIVARQVGVDPAVVSAPLISTVVDATGLIVYFLIAQAVLGL